MEQDKFREDEKRGAKKRYSVRDKEIRWDNANQKYVDNERQA